MQALEPDSRGVSGGGGGGVVRRVGGWGGVDFFSKWMFPSPPKTEAPEKFIRGAGGPLEPLFQPPSPWRGLRRPALFFPYFS